MRVAFFGRASALLMLLVIVCVSSRALAADKDWNILVITSDEHNPKILGAIGHPVIKTPGIDRLVHEGLYCTKMYASDPICAPTRQAMITGNYPQEHGQFTNGHVFNENLKTWGDYFKSQGYTTACIGKTHTNNPAKFGFDYRVEGNEVGKGEKKSNKPKTWDPEDKKAYDASPDNRFSGMILSSEHDDYDGRVADESIRWLKENSGKKFFLHSSMVKPHWPWDAPNEFYHMYDPAKIDMPPLVPDHLEDNYVPRELKLKNRWNEITEQMHRVYRARYYGSLSWLDNNVKRLLDTIDELGLADRTLVIYTTDHGDMAAERGLWLKSLMFDASVRIPLVFRMPGVVPAGAKCDALLTHIDLLPTIAGLTGCAKDLPSYNISGKDYSQVLLGKAEGAKYAFSAHEIRDGKRLPNQLMARSQRWKFIYYPNVEQEKDKYVLYDMVNDPDEITNVAHKPENADVVAEHKKAIDDWQAGLKKPLYPPKKMSGKAVENKFIKKAQRGSKGKDVNEVTRKGKKGKNKAKRAAE